MPDWAIVLSAALAGSIVGSIVTILLREPVDQWKEKKKKQKEALRNHFQEFAVGIFMPLSEKMTRLTNSEGRVSVHAPPMMTYEGDFSLEKVNFEQNKLLSSFKLHFPSEAKTIESFRNNLVIHHQNFDRFGEKLEKLVAEKTGLPVRGGGQPPYIYDGTLGRLRLMLNHLSRNEPLTDDFRKAEIKHDEEIWTVGRGPTGYAVTVTEEEAQNCKSKLIEIMESTELQERASKIFDNAARLEGDSKRLAEHLEFICQKYAKFGSVLKKVKGCHICDII